MTKHTIKKKGRGRSNSSKRSGNTKQISPAKHWCFTINNPTIEDIKMISETSRSIVPRYVFQEETGENGTKHLQGYLQFKTKKRPLSIFKKKAHWEKCRDIRKSIEYCQKEDTRTGKIYRRGIQAPYKIEIREWKSWMQVAKKIIESEPDERKIDWFWEPDGNKGKTIFCKWAYLKYEGVVILSGKAHDMKHAIVSYYEKTQMLPKTILINVPRSTVDYLSYTGLEEIKDMFFYSGKYEGGMVCGPNPHMIIMANEEPNYSKMSRDRWRVSRIN